MFFKYFSLPVIDDFLIAEARFRQLSSIPISLYLIGSFGLLVLSEVLANANGP